MAYEFWENNFCSTDGFPANVRISGTGDADRLQSTLHFFHRNLRPDPAFQGFMHQGGILRRAAVGDFPCPRIGLQPLEFRTHEVNELGPAVFGHTGDGDRTILAITDAVGDITGTFLTGLRHPDRIARGLAHPIPGKGILVQGEETIHHGDVDILSLSGLVPVMEGRQDSRCRRAWRRSCRRWKGGPCRRVALSRPAMCWMEK